MLPTQSPSYQNGFTLIELVIVIVILGVLSAVAVPRFIDLSQEADEAAVADVAGSLSSGSIINYSAFKVGSSDFVSITNRNEVPGTLQSGLPTGYTVTPADIDPDQSVSCALTSPEANPAAFQAIGTAAPLLPVRPTRPNQ